MSDPQPPPYPPSRPVQRSHHGVSWVDDLLWLHDPQQPGVLEVLQAEAAYAASWLGKSAARRAALEAEIRSRMAEDDDDPPVRRGAWLIGRRSVAGQNHPVHWRRPAAGGPEQIAFDENTAAQGASYYAVGGLAWSPCGRWLARLEDLRGDERYQMVVRDLSTGEDRRGEVVTGCKWSLAWSASGEEVFYTVADRLDRPAEVRVHRLGTSPSEDQLVLAEGDERFYLRVANSSDGRWVLIHSESKVTAEAWALPADRPLDPPRCVVPRVHDVEVEILPWHGRWVVRTTEGAPDYWVYSVPIDDPDAERQVLVQPGVSVQRMTALEAGLVLQLRDQGLPQFLVLPPEGEPWLHQPPERTAAALDEPNPDPTQGRFRYAWSSLRHPRAVVELDLETRLLTTLKVTAMPGGYDPDRYRTFRLMARAPDGVAVPMTVLCLAALRPGPHPALVYAYGAYGLPMEPQLRLSWLSLADRGVVIALAHARGGGELGRAWHRAAHLGSKATTFTDVLACSDALVDAGWADPDRLALQGGSAGGLMVGAVLNLDPGRFRCAVAQVPFVDVLTTMLDPSLPLTITEYDEWGNPTDDPAAFAAIRGYSPVDNLRPGPYPAVLATAGLHDPRVGYYEAVKWITRLRRVSTSGRPVMVDVDLSSGHQGAAGRYGAAQEAARVITFLLDQLEVP